MPGDNQHETAARLRPGALVAAFLLARARVLALPLALALAPLAITIPRLVHGMADACLASDFALTELSTGEAAHGKQLVGPYSRFGWRHPGPAYFYLLAPLYGASDGSSASLPVTALVFNWAAMLAMVLALRRWGEDWALLALALPLSLLYGAYLGPGFATNIWNPSITVLAAGVLLLASAAVACGRTALLPVLAALGSFLVQTHVGYLPCVATAVVCAAVSGWRARAHRRVGRIVAVTLALLALLWTPPLIEQLTRTPGNLTLVVRFFARGGGEHGLGEALAIVAREIAWPWCYLLFGARDQYAPYPALGGARLAVAAGFALAQAGLLALWSVRLRDRPFTRALARVCLACTLVAVPAVMRVAGEVRPYFTTWISLVGLLGALAALAPLLARWTVPRPAMRDIAALALVAGLACALAVRPVVRDSQFPPAREAADAVLAALRQRGTKRPQVTIKTGEPTLFYGASAVLLQLHKRGVAFAVDRPWWNFFGEPWRPTGAEDGALLFLPGPTPGGPAPIVCSHAQGVDMCVTQPR